jgi:hypothetical protein
VWRVAVDSGRKGDVGSLRHVHENAQNLCRIVNVVLFQIDVDCIADELEKFIAQMAATHGMVSSAMCLSVTEQAATLGTTGLA